MIAFSVKVVASVTLIAYAVEKTAPIRQLEHYVMEEETPLAHDLLCVEPMTVKGYVILECQFPFPLFPFPLIGMPVPFWTSSFNTV